MTMNSDIARTVCAAALALSALPLDDLPSLVTFNVGSSGVEAQLMPPASAGDVARALLAWQAALPSSRLRAAEYATKPGAWHVEVWGTLGGVPFAAWTVVDADDVTPALLAEARCAGGDAARAAAVLVDGLTGG